MEWDKNTKIIVAVVVVVVVIAAAIGIGIAANNNNDGGDKSTCATLHIQGSSVSSAPMTTYTVVDKDGKTVKINGNIDLPNSGKTTIKSESDGWTWNESMNIFLKGRYGAYITVGENQGTLTPIKNTGYVSYELSYSGKIDISMYTNDKDYSSNLGVSDSSNLNGVTLKITNANGKEVSLTASHHYEILPISTKITVANPDDWSWGDDGKYVNTKESKSLTIDLLMGTGATISHEKSGNSLYTISYPVGCEIVIKITVT